ncbi:MAG: M48 family metallopeptidase [Holophagales bacterium]|nr:M48 family metallopeptidase [Holophagales bacterium]
MPSEIPSSFEGSAFHPALPSGRAPGVLTIEPGRIRFYSATEPRQQIDIPFDGLGLRLGGASDRILFFSHPSLPEISVYTSDHRLLRHPLMASQASVAAEVAKVARRKTRLRAGTIGILAAIVLAIVGLVALKDPLVGLAASAVPPEAEVKLGDMVFGQIRATTNLVTDSGIDAELDELAAPLMASLPDTGYPFELHLADDPSLNAFALPGGNVVLHSGLVLRADTPEEILGVLGHEVAHVTERHSLEQIISSVGIFVLVQTFLGDVSGIAAVIADGGLEMLTLGFSRDAEREADAVGWDYLAAAEIDPRGMITFFEKLYEEEQKALGDVADYQEALSFLSTHPATGERIESLRERATEELRGRRFPKSSFDLEAFQDRIRQVITDTTSGDPPSAPGETPAQGLEDGP